MKALCLLLLFALGLPGSPAIAQPETRNWRFGDGAGLAFPPSGPPVAAPGGPFAGREACASISDASGSLQCYTNAEQVWDRTNAPMPNGALRFSHNSATQGALLVPSPRSKQEYYLFTVDAVENNLASGLRYSVIDMALRGGLGDVGPVKEVAVPLPNGQAMLTEKLTAVLLPNGRDYWIVVHGWENNLFYSFLLSPAGLRAAPVASSAGAVHRGGRFLPYDNSQGYLRVSPSGQRLAAVRRWVGVELFDFDKGTGRVTNAHPLKLNPPPVAILSNGYYGVEFSADGSKLYLGSDDGLLQVDLANQDAVAVIDKYSGFGLLRGNDGRIYVSRNSARPLSVIDAPNAAGGACGLRAYSVPLAPGTRTHLGLPNFPGGVPAVRAVLDAAESCAGSPTAFSASLVPAAAGAVFTWDFGDPAAGGPNAAVGPTASHTYAAAGTYTATVTAASPGGTFTARQTVVVVPPPALRLAPRQPALCPGQSLAIAPNEQPAGTTYRWHDGSTAPGYVARRPGWYRLTVRSATGCLATDSVEVRGTVDGCLALRIPNIITPNGDALNQTFVLQGLTPTDWALTVYNRWGREVYQQPRYDNAWAAEGQPAGQYYYLLRNAATGERYQGWLEVLR